MKAKPITYNGTHFRSTLEAKWAAFFDELEWPWEYEPFSTGDYIPDFALLGAIPTLVEVKPATNLRHLREQTAYVIDRLDGHWEGDILCVGVSPLIPVNGSSWNISFTLGLLQDNQWAPSVDNRAPAIWAEATSGNLDFFHDYLLYDGRMFGESKMPSPEGYGFISELWTQARNVTQWQKMR